ncbi:DUF6600 domain-containing protein [Burkholderia gladioli]|uniref:DUF6600 domain-containing protein n=1 Tax=Burkholderia gladioli TaxID=28095 RepID=UPI00163F18C0|nr:DUF6600 domain-containing protein [Burkholderia gladioli]
MRDAARGRRHRITTSHMTPHRVPLLLTSVTAAALLAFASLAAASAHPAQSRPQTPAPADPPTLVGRIDDLSGPVTLLPAGESRWVYAELNRPVTTGDQLWNDKGASSEMYIGSTSVRLAPSSALSILNLDESAAQLKLSLGTLMVHAAQYSVINPEVDTPNAALALENPGNYRIDVAPNGTSTTVTVLKGRVTAYADGGQMEIGEDRQITFMGTNLQTTGSHVAKADNTFVTWISQRDFAEAQSPTARIVSREMPGYLDLDANGTWRQTDEYGTVWTPSHVAADWAPYKKGHWIWQAPWGWTWIDDAPWGFAPYHYGRWTYIDNGWSWVPGKRIDRDDTPAYAPALVGFAGDADNDFDLGVDPDFDATNPTNTPRAAWFPLAPSEAWRPAWARWSPGYFQRVNALALSSRRLLVTQVRNTYINYAVPNGLTVVPAQVFLLGQPTARHTQHVDPRQWRNARLDVGAPRLAPVSQSFASTLHGAPYQPPAQALAHPVIAIHNPVVPAAFQDQLARQFAQRGSVPGIGAPVVRVDTPPSLATRPSRAAKSQPGATDQPNPSSLLAARPGQVVHLVSTRSYVYPLDQPVPARPTPPPPPTAGDKAAALHADAATPSPGAVPHPPAEAGPAASARQPAWTQPHAAIAAQHAGDAANADLALHHDSASHLAQSGASDGGHAHKMAMAALAVAGARGLIAAQPGAKLASARTVPPTPGARAATLPNYAQASTYAATSRAATASRQDASPSYASSRGSPSPSYAPTRSSSGSSSSGSSSSSPGASSRSYAPSWSSSSYASGYSSSSSSSSSSSGSSRSYAPSRSSSSYSSGYSSSSSSYSSSSLKSSSSGSSRSSRR